MSHKCLSVVNQDQANCLSNSLFRVTTEKTSNFDSPNKGPAMRIFDSKIRITGPLLGESSHDWSIPLTQRASNGEPVMGKEFPCHDIIINSLWLSDANNMVTHILVNIDSGNGLLPDGTKPLPEPMLTYHELGPVADWLRAMSREQPQPSVTKIRLKITYLRFHSNFPEASEFKHAALYM